MARQVSVSLTANITAYLSAMGQAEQATHRVADAADRLGDISISTDSNVAADLDQTASSADGAASSMEGAAGSAESMSGGMDSAGASAESASAGLESTGGAAQSAAGGLQEAGAAGDDVAASVGQVSAASQDTTAAMLAVSGSAQDAAGGLQSASGAAESTGAGFDTASASAQTAAGSLQDASGAAETVGAGFDTAAGSAQSAAGDIDTMAGTAQTASGGLSALAGDVDGLASSFASGLSYSDGFSGSLLDAAAAGGEFLGQAQGMRTEFTQMGGAMVIASGGLVALAGSVINTGIEYNNLQQVAAQALATMTEDAGAAAAQMERFDEFARNSPFFRDTWLNAQQQLMAFGMEAERVVPTLEGIEEAVAAIGGGDQEIRRLVDILGQIEGQGRITGRELQRMGQMGIDAAGLMGESMGMTADEIRTQITAGAIDAETAITALTDGMTTRFEGSSEAIKDTFQGATNDAIAFLRDLGSVIASPLVDPTGGGFLVDIMNMAADTLSGLRELPDPLIQIAGLGAVAAGGIGLVGGAFLTAAPHIMPFVNNMGRSYTAVWEFMTGTRGMSRRMRNIGIAAGVAAAAFAGLAIIRHFQQDTEDFAASANDMTQELAKAAREADAFTDIEWSRFGTEAAGLNYELDSLEDVLNRVHNSSRGFEDGFDRMFHSVTGLATEITDIDANLESLDASLSAGLDAGNFEYVAAGMREVAEAGELADVSAEELIETFPELSGQLATLAEEAGHTATAEDILAISTSEAALEALAAEESWSGVINAYEEGEYTAGIAADGALTLRDALQQQAEAAGEASDSLDTLLGHMNDYAGIALSAEENTDQWLASLRELDEAIGGEADRLAELEEAYESGQITQEEYQQGVEDAAYSLDRHTDAGQENRQMLRDLAADTWDVAAAEATRTGSLEATNDVVDQNIEALREAGEAANMTDDEIDEMIRTYMGFNDTEPIEIQAENRAQEIFDEVEQGLLELPDDFEIWLEAQDERAQATIDALMEGDHEAVVDVLGDSALAEAVIEAFESGDYRAVAELIAEDDEAQAVILDFQSGEYQAQVDILGNDDPANQILAALLNGDYQTLVDIMGEDADVAGAINAIVTGDHQALVDILGDDEVAQAVMEEFTSNPWMAEIVAEALTGGAEGELGGTARSRWSPIIGEPHIGEAEAALGSTARQRIADILGDPDTWTAEGELNDTARDRISGVLADSDTGLAEGDLNNTARGRISDILADPNTWNAEGELTSTARGRISQILADPNTWNAESDLNNTSRGRDSSVTADAHTWGAERDLNNAARNRTSTITVSAVRGSSVGAVLGGLGGGATGGRVGRDFGLPHLAGGGRLPTTGLGTDRILGIGPSGVPKAMLNDREWVINQRSSDRFDPLLSAINEGNGPAIKALAAALPVYQSGGVAGGYRPREFAAPLPAQPQQSPAPAATATMPSELTGTLYMESGAMLGQVRMAMRDPGVARAASQSLAQQGRRDGRAG